ncbi:MAG: hypothetical protein GY943_29230 [Chloroflexi bacterium]|nr:hypothetical protein [Chloroflexota bacterium]
MSHYADDGFKLFIMKCRFFCLFLLILIGLLGKQSATAVLAQSEPAALTAAATYTFGQAIRFSLVGETAVPVQSAHLNLKTTEMGVPLSVETPITTEKEIQLEHLHDLAEIPLLPFTMVTYWWELQLESGELVTVPEASFVYEDSQFMWQSLEKGEIAVHWTGNDPVLGELVLEIVAESQVQMQSLFPTSDDFPPVRLYLYPSSADLRAMLRLANHPLVGNHANPGLGVLLVTAVNARTAATDLRKSIPHELVHQRLYQLAGENYAALPTWFNEGLATLVEAVPDPNDAAVLETAVENQITIPFVTICNEFPTSGRENILAVAQSVSMLQYIQQQYGQQALRELIADYAGGMGCETAVTQLVAQPIEQFEQEWLQAQQDQTQAGQIWVDNGLWLLLILFGALFMGLLVWRL